MSNALVIGKDLKKYFMEHVDKSEHSRTSGFFKLVKPLCVFKRVWYSAGGTRAIANLIIPVGATVYVDKRVFHWRSSIADRKMRADKAYVYSVALKGSGKPVQSGFTNFGGYFRYRQGRNVKPTYAFSDYYEQCASGIHFFLNLDDAKRW